MAEVRSPFGPRGSLAFFLRSFWLSLDDTAVNGDSVGGTQSVGGVVLESRSKRDVVRASREESEFLLLPCGSASLVVFVSALDFSGSFLSISSGLGVSFPLKALFEILGGCRNSTDSASITSYADCVSAPPVDGSSESDEGRCKACRHRWQAKFGILLPLHRVRVVGSCEGWERGIEI